MSHTAAFALRADHEDFAGGSLAWGANQQTFDVGAALQQGGGVILIEVDDANPNDPGKQLLVEGLDNYPALKRIGVNEARQRATEAAKERAKSIPKEEAQAAAEHPPEVYDEAVLLAMDNDTLHDVANGIGAQVKSTDNKDALVGAILKHQKGGDAR